MGMASGKDLSVVICGGAGYGVQTVEDILAKVLKRSGYHVFATREYMSRVRGGNNSTEIRISSTPVDGMVDEIDLLVVLSPGVRENIRNRITKNTVIAADRSSVGEEFEKTDGALFDVALGEMAKEAGGAVYANVIAAGLVLGIVDASTDQAEEYFLSRFGKKGDKVVDENRSACGKGLELGRSMADKFPNLTPPKKDDTSSRRVMNGVQAVSLGAIAGGCDFVTAYPMSPATGVLAFAAQNASEFGLAVEQVEDEISAVNMAVGASYAGASPMVTTSGGGFSLMYEGFSLAGVAETPLVVHLAQRPGPATGMATRTEQGDLNLAVHAGHGEFPRLVLAPGTIEEAYSLTARAFEIAHRYQVQSVVMTDQYLLNTFRDVDPDDLTAAKPDKCLVTSGPGYRRYEDIPNGVSPRSVPGLGKGIVGCDSHEHDEEGHVFEDFDLRVRMSDKRFRKGELLKEDFVPADIRGPENWTRLVLCWGSTGPIVSEALRDLKLSDTAIMRVRQIWPVAEDVVAAVERADELIFVEGNHDGQLENLIKSVTGRSAQGHLRNYCGLQFSVEQVRMGLSEILG